MNNVPENTRKIIGCRINKLLAINNVKQKELAAYLSIPDNTVSYFVKGARVPNIEQIIKIAKYFNVSTDYLLGLTNAKTTDANLKMIVDYTGLSEDTVRDFSDFKNKKREDNSEVENSIDDYLEWNIMHGTFMDIISPLTHLIQLKALFLTTFEEYNLSDISNDVPTFLTEFHTDKDSSLKEVVINTYLQLCQRLNLYKLDIYNEFSHIIDGCVESIQSYINAENYKDLKTYSFDKLYSKYITKLLQCERSGGNGKHKED